ncbi:MAG: low molecular weight phosphotyrosine protein phosphatase, partial [Bacteroidales bacterium]|nr:low molecular weight phosphotyrosine protein phosphatase [Bacteroidales bacterium]
MDNSNKYGVIFVCHGNICRSPMAEFILRRLINQASLA